MDHLPALRLARKRQPGNSMYFACHEKGSRGPAAATRAAAPPGSSVYCACHENSMYCACHEKGSRGPAAATTRVAAPPGGSVYCACHAKGSQETLCTAPATRKAAAAQRRPRASQLRLPALCSAPATRKAPAAQRRPRAPQLLQEALCTALARQKFHSCFPLLSLHHHFSYFFSRIALASSEEPWVAPSL